MTDTTDNRDPHPAGSVGWFEVGTDDAATAQRFYGEVFGWTFAAEDPRTPSSPPGPATRSRAASGTRPSARPAAPRTYAVPCIVVDDVAATCAAVESPPAARSPSAPSPPERPVWAMVDDPAGNTVGVFSPPPA